MGACIPGLLAHIYPFPFRSAFHSVLGSDHGGLRLAGRCGLPGSGKGADLEQWRAVAYSLGQTHKPPNPPGTNRRSMGCQGRRSRELATRGGYSRPVPLTTHAIITRWRGGGEVAERMHSGDTPLSRGTGERVPLVGFQGQRPRVKVYAGWLQNSL